jgi:hypothetical protein
MGKPIPENQKLWNLLLGQAKAKYPSHGDNVSFPGAKWLSAEYARQGGKYVGSKHDVPENLRDKRKEAEDSKKRKLAEAKKKNRDRGFIN